MTPPVPAAAAHTAAPTAPPSIKHVAIIGAGVAGMAAAATLTSAGVRVTLIEASRRLGGRAASHPDPGDPTSEFDACQHVLLGCCTNLLDFYRRINALQYIAFQPAIRFMTPTGKVYTLGPTPGLPAPLHLGLSFSRFAVLSFSEKLAVARAMLAMCRIPRNQREPLDNIPFGDFLKEHRQPDSLLLKLYEPVLLGSLNEDPRKASARYAIQVFHDALLAHAQGSALGVATVPLSQLYTHLQVDTLLLGKRVTSIATASNTITSLTLSTGETITADAYILATNHPNAVKILGPAAAQDSRFAGLGQIQSIPILGVHLRFDRPILPDHPHVALLEGPLQWLFRDPTNPHILHGVISAARAAASQPHDQLLASFLKQIHSTLPHAKNANLEHSHIVIEKRATFAALPGTDKLRPPQSPRPGDLSNLYLAGDYTTTAWPATMEGAARSGYLAAEALTGQRFLVADLPTQWPAKLLGLGLPAVT